MAVDVLPPTWIASWSEDGTNVTFPIASVPELSAAEADAASGDMRKVAFAICEKLFQHYNGLDTADQPARMTISSSSSINSATNTVTKNYTFSFTLDVSGLEVASE